MPSVQQMIQLTEHAYRGGDISYLQTLEANRQLVDTQMREVQLKAELIALLSFVYLPTERSAIKG